MSILDGFKEVGESNNGKLTMTVMLESVRFSKNVSAVLGFPKYVKVLVNNDEKKFAIQKCNDKDEYAIRFATKKPGEASAVTLRNVDLLVATQKFFSFPELDDPTKIAFYALDGEYYSDEQVIVFNVEGAKNGTVGKRGPKAGSHRKTSQAK
ncbi:MULTISPECIES: hypothetical protein [Bifidobacterium]|uniref:Uncharacterized protein n=2 Tax=Bifidobacterium adolescentis TaxID=1680 RepID=A1A351_BIFAA|nr:MULTISPECIES: hypothetical protein [Bifidobacterium]MBV3435039.1 hypothetical protein [Bifidobacterium adolescentis]MCT6790049.1 hypothetical protein [Bifidobacterium adolescentis]NRD15670.1 hypothetical protein [Bifidobacterium adolescentis]OSG96454.1 hypothetical protein AL0462_1481 [Bifidobacterium adolescentis]OSG97337.1 hypothetical protein LMG10733_1435 [Bifidobacterium adolescentis]